MSIAFYLSLDMPGLVHTTNMRFVIACEALCCVTSAYLRITAYIYHIHTFNDNPNVAMYTINTIPQTMTSVTYCFHSLLLLKFILKPRFLFKPVSWYHFGHYFSAFITRIFVSYYVAICTFFTSEHFNSSILPLQVLVSVCCLTACLH